MRDRFFLRWAGLLALVVLVAVPAASALDTAQAQLAAAESAVDIPSRGVQAIVSVPQVVLDGGSVVYSHVRLEADAGHAQIGWMKSEGNSNSDFDCDPGGNDGGVTFAGIQIESRIGDTYSCQFMATPLGYTWGQAVEMRVQYVGTEEGDPEIDGDFIAWFDNFIPFTMYDLGWIPSFVGTAASVGSEWFADSADSPYLYRTAFSGLAYQPVDAELEDPFVVADDALFHPKDPVSEPFAYNFYHGSDTNSGSIVYPAESIISNMVLDNFNRADENPLSFGGNWAQGHTSWCTHPLKVLSNRARSTANNFNGAYWTPSTFSGDIKVFGKMTDGWPTNSASQLGLLKDVTGNNTVDGYVTFLVKTIGGYKVQIRRLTNNVATILKNVSMPVNPVPGDLLLFRTNGALLQTFISKDLGLSWLKITEHSDNTYRTGLSLHIGVGATSGGGPGWDDFGGGLD